jgi:hypothetical protein
LIIGAPLDRIRKPLCPFPPTDALVQKLSISNKEPLEVLKLQTDRVPAVAEAIKRVRGAALALLTRIL